MSAIYKTCKSIAPRILLICLAAHLGCFFGRQAFFLVFNSLRDVAATYVSEWPALLRELFNPRSIEYALQFAVITCNDRGMGILYWASAISIKICIAKQQWAWGAVVTFLSFSALNFCTGLAWHVGNEPMFTRLFD
jgi:hypothetical protein